MARFQRLVPILYVTDLEAEVDFYGILGFEVDDLTALVELCRAHDLRHVEPELYWERMDAWEMKVWSPNGYRIYLEGKRPRGPQGR